MSLAICTDAQIFQVFGKFIEECLCGRSCDAISLINPEGHSLAKASAIQKGVSFSFVRGCIGSGERLLVVPIQRDKLCAVEEMVFVGVGFEPFFCDSLEVFERGFGCVKARVGSSFRLKVGHSGDRCGLERCKGAKNACDCSDGCNQKLGVFGDDVAECFVFERCGGDSHSREYSTPQISQSPCELAHVVSPKITLGKC